MTCRLFVDRVDDGVRMFEMRFTLSKCKALLRDRNRSNPNLVLEYEDLLEVGGSNCLGNCISPGGRISSEVYSRARKAGLALINLRRL